MAKINIKFPDELAHKISLLGDRTDEVCEKALKAGAEIVEDAVRSNLESVIGRDTKYESRSTGELIDSLGTSKVDVDDKGNYNIKIGFNEPRRKQYDAKGPRSYYEITNAMIGNVIEHGKHGQPPKPFLQPAKLQSKRKAEEKMKTVIEEEINKI